MSVALWEGVGTLGGVGPEGRQKEDPIGSSLTRGCGVICPTEVKGMGRGDEYKHHTNVYRTDNTYMLQHSWLSYSSSYMLHGPKCLAS